MRKYELFSIILTKLTELICLILLFSHNFNKKIHEKYQIHLNELIIAVSTI